METCGRSTWSNDALVRVSTATGEELGVVGLTLNGLPLTPSANSDLAVRFDGQMLLVSANQFYSVNTSTGGATLLFTDNQVEPAPGSVAPPTLVGAAVGGYLGSEQLFGLDVAGQADLYRYGLETAFSRVLEVTNVLPQLDAGRGDLALLIQPVASGDYNHNGVVDAADYTIWRDTLGSTTDLRANGDDSGASMNRIDQADYLVWKNKFGHAGLAAASASQVPEPTPDCYCSLSAMALRFGKSPERNAGARTTSCPRDPYAGRRRDRVAVHRTGG